MNHDSMLHAASMHSRHEPKPKPFWQTRYAIGLLVMGAIATYFLLSEHRAHFLGALPFLLLLACPQMHVFMHHSHGSHDIDEHAAHVAVPPPTPLMPALPVTEESA